MRYCGVSENFHNAAIAFVEEDGVISFAAESERYSKVKNDPVLHKYLRDMIKPTDRVAYYENHDLRKKYSSIISSSNYASNIKNFEKALYKIDTSYMHHESHAASAFYTRPWESVEDTVILTIDGFGEYQSATIMDSNFNLLYENCYPNSIGLLYAFATRTLGLKALEEEYIVMGMAAFGDPSRYTNQITDLYNQLDIKSMTTIFDLEKHLSDFATENDVSLAASVQALAEQEIMRLAKIARKYGKKLCYSGGVAQNIVANTKIKSLFDDMWIAINPGDGGSAIGAAARAWALGTGKNRLVWKDPYLGFDMKNDLNPKEIAKYISDEKYCGVLSGRAEFGPRALGNRSLLANPAYDIKDTVNRIKNRQKYRPFAPAIMEEFADEYFEGPMNEYMQYTAKAKHDYKSVTHVDGSARVQIVPKNSTSILRKILEEFYTITNIPMLLNTSLNVRGRPICNDKYDGHLFEVNTKTKVFY